LLTNVTISFENNIFILKITFENDLQ